jgi:hypothetical protein
MLESACDAKASTSDVAAAIHPSAFRRLSDLLGGSRLFRFDGSSAHYRYSGFLFTGQLFGFGAYRELRGMAADASLTDRLCVASHQLWIGISLRVDKIRGPMETDAMNIDGGIRWQAISLRT